MRVQLLTFDGCPNAAAARRALRRCLEAAGLPSSFDELDTGGPDTPDELKNWGSPTILVDGVDVGGESIPTGTSCRLYDNPDHRGVPSDDAILAALKDARKGGPAAA